MAAKNLPRDAAAKNSPTTASSEAVKVQTLPIFTAKASVADTGNGERYKTNTPPRAPRRAGRKGR